jgi:hypothetical protein
MGAGKLKAMTVSKTHVIYLAVLLIAILSLSIFVRNENPKHTLRPRKIYASYFNPEESSETSEDSTEYYYLNWIHRTPDDKVLALAPKVLVNQAATPAVFTFLNHANKLEILSLDLNENDKRCVLTGVESLSLLRTLEIRLFNTSHQLENCHAIAECQRLKCVVFAGVRFSANDIRSISQSRSIETVRFDNYCRFDPDAISELRHLSTLKMVLSEFASARILIELSQIPSLEILGIGPEIADALDAIKELQKLPKLKYFSIVVKEDKRNFVRATLPGVELHLLDDTR